MTFLPINTAILTPLMSTPIPAASVDTRTLQSLKDDRAEATRGEEVGLSVSRYLRCLAKIIIFEDLLKMFLDNLLGLYLVWRPLF